MTRSKRHKLGHIATHVRNWAAGGLAALAIFLHGNAKEGLAYAAMDLAIEPISKAVWRERYDPHHIHIHVTRVHKGPARIRSRKRS